MALQRRLVAGGVLTVSSLLCVYILGANLKVPLSWSLTPLKHGYAPGASNVSRDSEEPLGRTSQPPSALPFHPEHPVLQNHKRARLNLMKNEIAHQKVENDVLDVSKSSSSSDGLDKTWIRTEGPTPKPQRLTQAPRTTEPSYIGDTYMSEDVPPQTDCPDGIQSRLTQTEFGERFLRNIPVLQWAKHVTPEQHQRLSQYPGAHGWGGVDYATLAETLSVLNSSANWQMFDDWKDRGSKSECIRCAVVGNGGILNNSKKGEEIDSHHYVFRTNGAVIKGFEKDVGSRTTHYTFSTNTMMNSMRSYAGAGYRGPPQSKETRYVFLPDHDRDYLLMKAAATHTRVPRGPEWNKDPSTYFGKDASAEKFKMYHPDFIRYLRNRFLRSPSLRKFKNIYRPTTGAVMLLAALHTCNKVSAYGFMTPDYNSYSDHYFDIKHHPVAFFANHDMRLELILWQKLHQAGLIQLYMHK